MFRPVATKSSHRMNGPQDPSRLVRLITVLTVLSVGFLLSHAFWFSGEHDAAACSACCFLKHATDRTGDAAVVALLLVGAHVVVARIRAVVSSPVRTYRTRAPPAVLITQH